MTKEIGVVLQKLLNGIWRKGGIPEDWNKGIICPIFKKGERREVKNYRGITLMDTVYKIYVNILNRKLMEETEMKLQETQFGFRKERGSIDAIYIMNYIINRELKKKGGKVFAFFADLKAAFDKVNRRKLNDMMGKLRINNNVKSRIMETYKETRNVIRVGSKKTEEFWTEKGVRQGH